MKILIVDDEPKLCKAMSRLLGRRATVMSACQVEDAVAELEQDGFDVVLTDFHLGEGRTGLDLLDVVQKRWPTICRLLMSGRARPTTAELASWPCHDFLEKPCDADQIFEAVERFLLPLSAREPADGDIDSASL